MAWTPPRPSGTDLEARWHQWVHDMLLSLRPQDVPGAKVHRTSRGFAIIPNQIKGGTGISVTVARFKSQTNEYLICRSWDGTNEGANDILIAKPEELRNVASEEIDGVVTNYSNYDWDSQSRTATRSSDGTVETQFIVPRYLDSGAEISIIRALPCFTGAEYETGELSNPDDPNSDPVMKPVGLIDLNLAGRAWAAQ